MAISISTPNTPIAIGETVELNLTDAENVNSEFMLSSSDESIASVSPNATTDEEGNTMAQLTALKEGTVTVTVTQADDPTNTAATNDIIIEADVAEGEYFVTLSSNPQGFWTSSWGELSTNLTALVVDAISARPVRDAEVTLVETSDPKYVKWIDGSDKGKTSFVGEHIAPINIQSEADSLVVIDLSASTTGAAPTPYSLLITPADKDLALPYFPTSSGNLLDQNAIDGGVFAQITYTSQVAGDTVVLVWDDLHIDYAVTGSTLEDHINIEIPSVYLTQGVHNCGYYIIKFGGNVSFSMLRNMIVQRDDNLGIIDQPVPIIAAANKGFINEYDMLTNAVMVEIPDDATLNIGDTVIIYWKGYDLQGNPLETAEHSSPPFTVVDVDAEIPPLQIPTNILQAIGTGTAQAYYNVTKVDSTLHSSLVKAVIIDVVPPGK